MQTTKKASKLEMLQKLVVFMSKSAGREQSCRLIQYTCTFLANTLQDKDINSKILMLGGSMSATRKVLRFGKPIAVLVGIVNNIKAYLAGTQGDKFDKSRNLPYLISSLISNFWSLVFFFSDHYIWFCNIGVIINPSLKDRIVWWNDFTWIWESLCDCICAAIEIHLLNQKLAALPKNSEDYQSQSQKIKDRFRVVTKDLIKSLLNIPMAYGFVTGNVSKQKIGFLGIITSSMAIQALLA